jgi:hypothetical protein
MTNMGPDQVTRFIDHAAVQNDRYLFVALLILVIASAFLLVRWAITQNGELNRQSREDGQRLATVVEANTAAFREQSEALGRLTEELRRV